MSSDNEPTIYADAIRHIEERNYREAVNLLSQQISTATGGESAVHRLHRSQKPTHSAEYVEAGFRLGHLSNADQRDGRALP